VKENQREQDRICNEYYDERKQSPRGHRGGSGSPSPPRSRGAELTSAVELDIYRHTMQSHGIYADTMERWRQQVSENDRRNEAFRRQVLKATRSGSRQKEVQGRRRVSKSGLKDKKDTMLLAQISLNSDPDRAGGDATASSKGPEGRLDFNKSTSSLGDYVVASPQLWKLRRQQSLDHYQELDQKLLEKHERDAAGLQAGRDRIASSNKEIMERAEERSRQWQQRNDEATARRLAVDVKSDSELTAKQAAFDNRRAQLAKARDERTAEAAHNKMQYLQSVQATRQSHFDKADKDFNAKSEEREDLLLERYNNKMQEYVKRVEQGGPYYVMAVLAKSRKKQIDEEFRRKAKKESEMKVQRFTGALANLQKPALAKQRTMKKASRSLSRSGTISMPELPFAFSPDELDSGLEDALASALAPQSPQIRTSPSMKSPPGSASGTAQAEGRSSRRPSMVELADDDGVEAELLQDLERRSSNWLHDMRRKKAQIVSKIF